MEKQKDNIETTTDIHWHKKINIKYSQREIERGREREREGERGREREREREKNK